MKKISKILALALAVFMLVELMPTNVFAEDTRKKINKITATSDTDSIPKYGEKIKYPTINVTEGAPARFAVGYSRWKKKEGEKWKSYEGKTFTEGTYKYEAQIRVDGDDAKTHVLDNNLAVTVDDKVWSCDRPATDETCSYTWAYSQEF